MKRLFIGILATILLGGVHAAPPVRAQTPAPPRKASKPLAEARTKPVDSPPPHEHPDAPPPYKHGDTLPSLAISLGGYLILDNPVESGAFALDLDAGAWLLFGRNAVPDVKSWPILCLWPVGGYSYVAIEGQPMHLATAGLGFGVASPTLAFHQATLVARFVLGSAERSLHYGARVDLRYSVLHSLAISVGYQVLKGTGVLHGLRIMAMLDVVAIFAYFARYSGHIRTMGASKNRRPEPRKP